MAPQDEMGQAISDVEVDHLKLKQTFMFVVYDPLFLTFQNFKMFLKS